MIYEETEEARELESYWGTELPPRSRLIPTDSYLRFSYQFILACSQTPPEMDCLNIYCNGWEL